MYLRNPLAAYGLFASESIMTLQKRKNVDGFEENYSSDEVLAAVSGNLFHFTGYVDRELTVAVSGQRTADLLIGFLLNTCGNLIGRKMMYSIRWVRVNLDSWIRSLVIITGCIFLLRERQFDECQGLKMNLIFCNLLFVCSDACTIIGI